MADTEIEGSDLSALVSNELRQAQTFDQTKRARAIEYMRGEMADLPARPNGSQQTSRDVADIVSWMLPGVIRVFTASDRMVEYTATQPGGEKGAEESSDYANYSFFRENNGYQILFTGTHDSILMGNGAVCSYWCPEESKTKWFRDKTIDEVTYLIKEDGWQETGIAKPGKPRTMPTDLGDIEVPTLTVKLQKITERGQIRDMACKPENLRLSANSVTIEGARLVAYLHDDKTRSDLMEMADQYGWDTDVIENLPRFSQRTSDANTGEVASARLNNDSQISQPAVKSGDFISLYECYYRCDKDGDGIAELLQVWYAGDPGSGHVLSSDEWEDDVPFTDIPCYPVPHRWEAEGVYDRAADIQRVKTTLLRQGIDNTYAVNMPMREVEAGSVLNPDILINPKFNGLIWKKTGSAQIIPHVIPYTADKSFAALEYMDQVIAKRTGVSRTTMALDPETLQNQTATANQNQHDAGYSQIELVARNQAELGWVRFFAKRRNIAKKYIKGTIAIPSRNGAQQQQQPMPAMDGQMPMDGQQQPEQPQTPPGYRSIQPEDWSDDVACTINVGLGTGSRDRDMQMLNLILNGQVGMAERLGAIPSQTARKKAAEFIGKIRKTSVEMAESSGLRNPDDYYPEITDQDIQAIEQEMGQAAQQPDPAIAMQQQKLQADTQLQGQKMQADQQAAVQKQQNDAMAQQQDFQLKQAQLTQELQLKREQLAAELQLKREQMIAELGLQRELGHAKVAASAAVTSDVHPGGAPG